MDCETSLAVPIQLSRTVARFNRVVTNPIQLRYAWLLPPWAVIVHQGRRSGRRYRTPVMAFVQGSRVAVVIMYGERSDWVRNVLAGEGSLVRGGRTHPLSSPRVVGPREVGGISVAARVLGRMTDKLLVAELGEAEPGFGRGPGA